MFRIHVCQDISLRYKKIFNFVQEIDNSLRLCNIRRELVFCSVLCSVSLVRIGSGLF